MCERARGVYYWCLVILSSNNGIYICGLLAFVWCLGQFIKRFKIVVISVYRILETIFSPGKFTYM